MREITEVIPTEDYRLKILFDDGERAIVDVKPLMKRKVFQPLKDRSFFRQVEIDRKFGGVQWPNGADVCIDWIEAALKTRKTQKSAKAELVSQIAAKTKVPEKAVDEVLKSLIEEIRHILVENRKIRIPELGTFSVVEMAERTGVNVQDGAKILVAKTPRFRASKSLKDAVRKSKRSTA